MGLYGIVYSHLFYEYYFSFYFSEDFKYFLGIHLINIARLIEKTFPFQQHCNVTFVINQMTLYGCMGLLLGSCSIYWCFCHIP